MDPVEAARDLLPASLPWLNAVFLPVAAAGVAVIAFRLAMHLARPRLRPSAHWTERAAERYAGSILLGRTWLLCLLGALLLSGHFVGPLGFLDLFGMIAAFTATVSVIGIFSTAPYNLRFLTQVDRRTLLRANVTDFLILAFPWVPALLTMAVLPATPGPGFFAVLGGGAVLLAWAIVDGGLDVARWLGLARTAPEGLRDLVDRVAKESGVRTPRVFIAEFGTANAFAFPLRNALCFGTRTLEILTEAELERVAAHELSHLNESRADKLKRLLPTPNLLLVMVARPMMEAWSLTAVLVAFLAATYLRLLARRVALRLERCADADARTDDSEAAVAYAGALEKIYRESLLPAVAGRRPGTHPELYDRMTEAGVTPDFPRPEPPPSRLRQLVIVGATIAVLCGALWGVRRELMEVARDDETAALVAASLTGGDGLLLSDLGFHRLERGETEDAVVMHRAVVALHPFDSVPRIYLAETLLAAGETDEAREALRVARVLIEESEDVEPWVLEYLIEIEQDLADEPRE